MEVDSPERHTLVIMAYEVLGTAILLLGINWGATGGGDAQALAIGIA